MESKWDRKNFKEKQTVTSNSAKYTNNSLHHFASKGYRGEIQKRVWLTQSLAVVI